MLQSTLITLKQRNKDFRLHWLEFCTSKFGIKKILKVSLSLILYSRRQKPVALRQFYHYVVLLIQNKLKQQQSVQEKRE